MKELQEFTVERLEEIIEWTEVFGRHPKLDECTSLAKISLAAKQAEPIGEVRLSDYGSDGCRQGSVTCLHDQADWDNFPDGTKLYTTPPLNHTEQDGWTKSDAANAALVMLDRIDTTDPVDDDRIEGIKRIIRQLSEKPTEQHMVVPDGWIKCSEHMPEDGQIVVIINAGHGEIYEAATVTRHGPHFLLLDGLEASNYDGGAVVTLSLEATHWMPLPAAPKPESE